MRSAVARPFSVRSVSPRVAALVTGTACLAATMVAPAPALASNYPAQPTRVALSAATDSSLTVSAARSRNATLYRLYVSTVKSDLFVQNLRRDKHSSARHYAASRTPSVTMSRLRYTTDPYYYRFVAINGPRRAYSTSVAAAGLRPTAPTDTEVSSTGGLHLTWDSVPTTGFTVLQATNPGMTDNRVAYPLAGSTHQFTPFHGVTKGGTYYFQVRGVNNRTRSTYTAPRVGTAGDALQGVRLMTYNILQTSADNVAESGYPTRVVSPWSQRGPAAAALIHRAEPAVIAVQEGNDPVGQRRQVDTLAGYLDADGDDYAVANTGPENLAGGPYILYKTSMYRAVGAGGHWDLDGSAQPDVHRKRWASYQELENVDSGARFLFVSVHTIAGSGLVVDQQRQRQTQSMLTQAGALAARLGVPVIYGGDFNSNAKQHELDGPGVAMSAAGAADAHLIAQSRMNFLEDTFNGYARTSMPYSIDIDYLYAPTGVAVSSWGVLRPPASGAIPSDHNPVYSYVYYRY